MTPATSFALLSALVFLALVLLLRPACALPLLAAAMRRVHVRNHHHGQHNGEFASNESVRKGHSLLEERQQGATTAQGDGEPQVLGMRVLQSSLGLGHWLEAQSNEMHIFAFTYFGMITLLLVLALVLVSCCYMFDGMGCYEQSEGKHAKGSVFPMAMGGGQVMVMMGGEERKKSAAGTVAAAGGRRWSSPLVHL